MKTILFTFISVTILILASCQTASIQQGGGGYAQVSRSNCAPSRAQLASRGGNNASINQSWSFSLIDLQVAPAGAVGFQPGFRPGFQGGQCPPQGFAGRPPVGRPGFQQPRPCPPGFGNGYQRQPSGYPGHASNPIMVNGVAFSDQYPGGVRVARPR
jgi:hypothetical protein